MLTPVFARALVSKNLVNMMRLRCASFDQYEIDGVLEVLRTVNTNRGTRRKHTICLSLQKFSPCLYMSLQCDEDLETPIRISLYVETRFKLECFISQKVDHTEESYTEIDCFFIDSDIGGSIACTNWDNIVDELAAFSFKRLCPMPKCKKMFMPNFGPENICSSCAPFLTEEEASEKMCVFCMERGNSVGMVHCNMCHMCHVCHVCFDKMCCSSRIRIISCPLCMEDIVN